MIRIVGVVSALFFTCNAQSPFMLHDVLGHLDEGNPYVYTAIGARRIAEAKAAYARGAFDTMLQLQYDEKAYPASEGSFKDISLSKPLGNGIELLAGYREATGVQEYNNIKTGDEGELRLGLKLPIVEMLHDTSPREFASRQALLDAKHEHERSLDALRQLSYEIAVAYYELLFSAHALALESDLLQKATIREGFIKTKVDVGAWPQLSLTEAKAQIIDRSQRHALARNRFDNALQTFCTYLDIDAETFQSAYALPPFEVFPEKIPDLEAVMQESIAQRPDLRALDVQEEQYRMASHFNDIQAYPQMDLALYGVHDFKYDEGYKVTFGVRMPLERRSYHAKTLEIAQGSAMVHYRRSKALLEMRKMLTQELGMLATLKENAMLADEELALTRMLEAAEAKKYRLGMGNLFTLNQREVVTLQVAHKALEYRLRFWKTLQAVEKERGSSILLRNLARIP